MQQMLHSFLQQAENAELPEGEYIKVCNALKKSFESVDTPPTPTVKTSDITFILKFVSHSKIECMFSFTKYMYITGPFPNRAVYSLKVSKDNKIIKEIVNKEDELFPVEHILKKLIKCHHFNTFTITTDVGIIEYNTDEVRQAEWEIVKDANDRGNVYEDDDEPWTITLRPEVEFIINLCRTIFSF